MATFDTLIAIPVLAQFMTGGGIHGRDQLEGIERLAACIHFLKHNADGFLGGRTVERNHRHAIHLEVFQHLFLEGAELFPHRLVFFARPVIVESVLPRIPVEHLVDREHQRRIFLFRRGQIEGDFASEIRALHAIFRHAEHGFLAVHRLVNRFGDVDVEPPSHALFFGVTVSTTSPRNVT